MIFSFITITKGIRWNNAKHSFTMMFYRPWPGGSKRFKYDLVVGDALGIDKSSVSRVVTQFSESLVNKKHLFIKFPRTAVEKDAMKKKFFKVGGFPSKIASVDCGTQ